jgi:TniQ
MLIKPLHLIPDWRGDETLYSWSARMHRLLGGATKQTGQRLFGASHAYKEWAASNHLDHLHLVTGGTLGSIRSILLQRTVLAAYYPFLRPEQRQDFDERAERVQRSSWVTRFGMRASNIDGTEMRWCRCCSREDVHVWGTSRWRLPHQLPGAWWCTEHDMPLNRVMPGRAEWAVPGGSESSPEVLLDIDGRQSLNKLSALAASLIGKERVDLPSIKRALLSRLRDMRVVNSIKPVSSESLQRWFVKTNLAVAVQQVEPKLQPVFDGPWIYETLLKRRSNHPLLWMMLWVAAFEDSSLHEVVRGFHEPDTTYIWQEDGQGMLWVEGNFQGDDRVQAIVRNAETIREAAQKLNVSIFTIRRYMREAQCAPKQIRAQDRKQARKDEAVAEIEALIKSTPDVSKTDIHRKCKGSVSWLAKWEPELLASLLAQISDKREKQLGLELGL